MLDSNDFPDLDWFSWVIRWDRMQERYLVEREERFEIITRLLTSTFPRKSRILDLGCGTGSLMVVLLKALPESQGTGVDLDPTLLLLADKQLASYQNRMQLIQADLRKTSWLNAVRGPFDAVVSATALHWLSPAQLSTLYGQIGRLLSPGGVFLNADHVASSHPGVQAAWISHRDRVLLAQADPTADDWDGFWKAYLSCLGPAAAAAREQALGDWQGMEEGQPLTWHFQHLLHAGFSSVDCFWRCDGDAIYGGFRT